MIIQYLINPYRYLILENIIYHLIKYNFNLNLFSIYQKRIFIKILYLVSLKYLQKMY